MANKTFVKTKKRAKQIIVDGRAHVKTTFNNTLVTITDLNGNVLARRSAGYEFKGPRKSTPFAAQVTAEKVAKHVADTFGMKRVEVIVCGGGSGGDSAARAINTVIPVTKVQNTTPVAHNGCRPPKERRI